VSSAGSVVSVGSAGPVASAGPVGPDTHARRRDPSAAGARMVRIGTELAQTRHTFRLRLHAEGCGWTTTQGGGSRHFGLRLGGC
jgi:hypothetical protein